MLSSLALRLKALSPFQLALLVLASLALLGSSTAVASNLITGADVKDRSLTGRDIARDSVTAGNVRNESLGSHDLQDGHVLSQDLKDGTVEPADLSPAVREQLGQGGGSGVVGKNGATGAKGDTGTQGPKGDTGDVGAPGAFLVKDADDTVAGPMLDYGNGSQLSFYYKGRAFNASSTSGALSPVYASPSYTTPDCSGTPYANSAAVQTALRVSFNDPGIYERGETASVDIRSSRSTGDVCNTFSYTNTMTRLDPIPASELPPVLHGPLRFAPAG